LLIRNARPPRRLLQLNSSVHAGPSLAKKVAHVDISRLNGKRERMQIFAEEPQTTIQ
jgi:hypothetical protein